MDDRQLDLFAPRLPASPDPASPRRPAIVPTALTDAELIAAIPDVGLQDCAVLAEEAGRRRLAAAVPALARLCRRFAGWGSDAAVPEQLAALGALTRIGGRAAAAIVAAGIVKAEFVGPTLAAAVAAAATLDATLPDDTILGLLRHDDRQLRADACHCVRASPAIIAALIELLDDLHPAVVRAAAIALGRLGRIEARPPLTRLLDEEPAPDIIGAFGGIADEAGLILLGRLAQRIPALAGAVLDTLEDVDHPLAASIAAALQVPD
jgi:HEAT repeats